MNVQGLHTSAMHVNTLFTVSPKLPSVLPARSLGISMTNLLYNINISASVQARATNAPIKVFIFSNRYEFSQNWYHL